MSAAASAGEARPTPRAHAFASRTLGCKVNQVEGEQVARHLLDDGFRKVDECCADVVVVHTCTVTGEADAKARKAIRRALTLPTSPLVVVTGCLAAMDKAGIAALGERVVVEPDVTKVPARVARLLGLPVAPSSQRPRVGSGFHTRAMVKVQDGCDGLCSYCIVPRARGVPRSVPVEQVVSECHALVTAGAKEIVLTGINIGRYADGRARLADLLRSVAATGVARLRLSSIEPGDLTEALLGTLASLSATCEHVHVPLQSGDDGILKAMGRSYTTAEYADRVAATRAALPGVAISTDVIAGFPGESDAQAEQTMRFCGEIGFTRLHVFRYSERAGTPAAEREDQVAPDVRVGRAARLRELGAELRQAHARSALGHVRQVLVERVSTGPSADAPGVAHEGEQVGGCGGTLLAEGVTRDYLRVRVRVPRSAAPLAGVGKLSRPDANVAPGSLVMSRLCRLGDDGVIEGALDEGRNEETADGRASV